VSHRDIEVFRVVGSTEFVVATIPAMLLIHGVILGSAIHSPTFQSMNGESILQSLTAMYFRRYHQTPNRILKEYLYPMKDEHGSTVLLLHLKYLKKNRLEALGISVEDL